MAFRNFKNVIRNIRRSQARFANLFLVLNKAFTSVEQAAEDETELDITYGDLKDSPDYQLLKEFVLEHRSIKEMAQERGITVDACKKRIQRAKERLKRVFPKKFYVIVTFFDDLYIYLIERRIAHVR